MPTVDGTHEESQTALTCFIKIPTTPTAEMNEHVTVSRPRGEGVQTEPREIWLLENKRYGK